MAETRASADLRQTLPQSLEEARASRDLSLQSSSAPLEPHRIPGYELEQVIGKGAFAEVWSAKQLRTQKKVALKIFKLRSGPHWLFLQREVERLSLLDKHPHIVSLLDADLTGDPPYYTMDLLVRGSLDVLVERGEAVEAQRAARWMEQVCEALVYVHAKGLIHCDLKPANMLRDDQDCLRLMDFGHSRILTASSGTLGTFFYMAPEQTLMLDHPQRYQPDLRWDIFSMGATFFALLSGTTPWGQIAPLLKDEEHLSAKLRIFREAVAAHPLPDLHRLTGGRVDRGLASIVAKCCDPDPELRYASALEVAADLRARREGRPVSALAGDGVYVTGRFLRRNRAAVAATAVGAALLLGAWGRQALHEQHLLRAQVGELYALRSRERATAGDTLAAAAYADAANQASPSQVAAWSLLYHLPVAPQALLQVRREVSPAFLPDGQSVLLGWRDGQLAWVGLESGKVKRLFDAPSALMAASPSPDGARLAASSADGSVRIWDLASGTRQGLVLRPGVPGPPVLAWSADGTRLATGLADGTLRIWDPALGQPVGGALVLPGTVVGLAFNTDRTALACMLRGGSEASLELLSLDPVPKRAARLAALGPGAAMAFFDQGGSLAVMQADGGLRLLTRRRSFFSRAWVTGPALPAPAKAPKVASLAASGGAVLRLESDGRLKLWALSHGRALPRNLPLRGPQISADLDPSGGQVICLSAQQALQAFDVLQGRPLGPAHVLPMEPRRVSLPAPGLALVYPESHGRAWDPVRGEALGRAFYVEPGQGVLTAPGGRWVLQVPQADSSDLLILNASRPESYPMDYPYRPQGPAGMGGAYLSPDATTLLTAYHRQAQFWDLESGRPRGSRIVGGGTLLRAPFRPDGKRALLAFADGGRLFDPSSPQQALRSMAWDLPPLALAFSPTGLLATGDARGVLRLWSADQGQPPRTLATNVAGLLDLAFSPDGDHLRCLTRSGLQELDLDGRRLGRAQPLPASYERFSFSDDGGAYLAVYGRELRLFDAADGEALAPPLLLEDEPTCLALSPDGSVLAAGAKDGFRLWDVASGQALGERFDAAGPTVGLAFSRDKRHLLVACANGAHRLWTLPWLGGKKLTPTELHARVVVATHLKVGPSGDLQAVPYKEWKAAWRLSRKGAKP